MTEFFVLPRIITWLVAFSLTLCTLAQTLSVVLCFYRYPRSRIRISETLLELLILGHIMFCTILHKNAEEELLQSALMPPELTILRYIYFASVATAVLSITVLTRKPATLPIIVAAALSLPLIESLTGYAFVYINLTAIAFWLVRSVITAINYYWEMGSGLSAFSVKNAIDSMITGVMFCERDGYILLVNEQMKRLIVEITGRLQRNGRHFLGLLTLGEIQPGCRVTWFEGQSVCILPDGSTWMFVMTELLVKRKNYIQLTAADITEHWKLASELEPQREELKRIRKGLYEAIENLHIISRERDRQTAKICALDLLGERLTVLLQIARNEHEPDYSLLRSMSHELIDELNTARKESPQESEFESLSQTFESIGINVDAKGEGVASLAKYLYDE